MPVAVDIKDVRTRVIAKLVAIKNKVDKQNFREAEYLVERFLESDEYTALHNYTTITMKNEITNENELISTHSVLNELLPAVRGGGLFFSSRYLIGLLLKAKF